LLLIYSAANLCDRSWGTREQVSGEDEGLWGWRVYIIQAWKVITSLWCCERCFSSGKGRGTEEGGVCPKKKGEKVEPSKSKKEKEVAGGGEGVAQEEDGAEVNAGVKKKAVEVSDTTYKERDFTDEEEEGNGESCKECGLF
jgi:hypothetical protein